jgi:hypothetical protein
MPTRLPILRAASAAGAALLMLANSAGAQQLPTGKPDIWLSCVDDGATTPWIFSAWTAAGLCRTESTAGATVNPCAASDAWIEVRTAAGVLRISRASGRALLRYDGRETKMVSSSCTTLGPH